MAPIHQNYVNLVYAALFGLIVSVSWPIWQGPDLLLRMALASVMFLLARDVLAGAAMFRGPRKISNPRRWVYAYYHALYFAIFMMLFNWRGVEEIAQLLIGTAIGAVLFAGMMGFGVKAKDHAYTHHFETEGADIPGKTRKIVFFVWPLLTIASLVAMAKLKLDNTVIIFAVPIFIGFLFPLYQRKPIGGYVWTNLPRIAGFVLLAAIVTISIFASMFEREPIAIPGPSQGAVQPIYQELSQ
ncbi:MAG: hypothetical protein L3J33_04145 [Rhodobacteraceae bacterium]|nr:hypothetical protein [Paracoccaceae bacterium]